MFKIRIIAVGKNKEDWVEQSVEHYLACLKTYSRPEMIYTAECKKSKAISGIEVMKKEAKYITDKLNQGHIVALHDRGRKFDSETFADYLRKLMQRCDGCAFIIGGAYGLDEGLIKRCDDRLSLSPMTMSHQLVRPVLLEQLYRALSIISGGKYHK
jgi:23S rRNA (pseudouridine1915-N3)-methyltransferase